MSETRIEIEELVDDVGNYFGAYCKGHVDKAEFCQAYKNEFDDAVDPEKVEHILARKVPRMRGHFYEGWLMVEVNKPGRGVFEATIIKE